MSLLSLIDPNQVTPGTKPAKQGRAGLGELAVLGYGAYEHNWRTDSREINIDEQESLRMNQVKEILGREVKPEDASDYKPFQSQANLDTDFIYGPQDVGPGYAASYLEQQRKKSLYDKLYIDKAIEEFRAKNPVEFQDVKTREQVMQAAQDKALLTEKEFAEAKQRTPGKLAALVSFGGMAAAGITDPLNLAASVFGIGQTKSILKAILVEAAINAGVETISQPAVAQWQKEIGNNYGFKEALENVGMAALFGGAFGGGAKGIEIGWKNRNLAASWVFSKMAANERLPKKVRDSFEMMANRAHTKENNPSVRSPSASDSKKHGESLKTASETLAKGGRLSDVELAINEDFFNSIDTRPRAEDPQTLKNSLAEIERFQRSPLEAQQMPRESKLNDLLNERAKLKSEITELEANQAQLLSLRKREFEEQVARVDKRISGRRKARLQKELNKFEGQQRVARAAKEKQLKAIDNQIDNIKKAATTNIRPKLQKQQERIIKPKKTEAAKAKQVSQLRQNLAELFAVTRQDVASDLKAAREILDSSLKKTDAPELQQPLMMAKARILRQEAELAPTNKKYSKITKEARRLERQARELSGPSVKPEDDVIGAYQRIADEAQARQKFDGEPDLTKPVDPTVLRETIERELSEEAANEATAAFAKLIQEKGDTVIELDGKSVTLRELSNEFKDDADYLREITQCGRE